ncbi:hypothetical protein ABD91_20890 [Lysinibacillus sphaericus]|uniref:hypothetical protein n=1 Tax=Lysinibacillus sphaericus TaxID=1421 RepID=UPI0018CD574D|nr:hypothetical protein [Lysinibacillus sphaericus]MBG9693200.1 hypothetical protein [Lysinibacillus sphaericus]
MKKIVIFKVGEAEIRIEGGMPQLSSMSQEGKDVMTINNAIAALNKSLGFDVSQKYPNIKETAKII